MTKVKNIETIFEKGNNCPLNHNRISNVAIIDNSVEDIIPKSYLEEEHGFGCDGVFILPEVSEIEIVRHYVELSRLNFGVDNGFYPLGSCTMKYNPKINEYVGSLDGFLKIHPLQPECQGSLELLFDLEQKLSEITGMDDFSLQPAAGAQGEFAGISIIKKYFEVRGELKTKTKILIPDSSHGTNPATSAMCGFSVIVINSNDQGEIRLDELEFAMQKGDVAGIMLTNPNTLGLFERDILKITEMIHKYGGLTYYDGANMNALMGKCKPGDMGFDIIHLNLHKTFSTPHGGGGPGAGPVGVKKFLSEFLPNPRIIENKGVFVLVDSAKNSIGKIKAFYGNFAVLIRAYTYILMLGADGLKRASENAVLNANYLKVKLSEKYNLPIKRTCMHEFVINDLEMANEVSTLDIAKRLLDYGVHAPTIYFPLIIPGAMMIEPTESETKKTLDRFVEIMFSIFEESITDPDLLKKAPQNTSIGRLDQVQAARKPILRYKP